MDNAALRTTVALSQATKARLDKWRAAGQRYDAFICQLVDLWDRTHAKRSSEKCYSDNVWRE